MADSFATAPLDLTDQPVHIAHADAQDTAKYRRARAVAEQQGQRLVIDPPIQAAPTRPGADSIVVSPATTPADYARLKALSETTGKPLAFVDGAGNVK